MYSPAMNDVWIVPDNALRFDEGVDDNPITHIIQTLYGIEFLRSANPVFTTEHNISDKHAASQCDTSKVHDMSIPLLMATTDAILTDRLLLGLQFHIVDHRGHSPLLPADPLKFGWIWRLCCMSRAALQTPGFSVAVECDRWKDIFDWMYLVSF